MSDEEGDDICAVCGIRSTKKCSNCRTVRYCSREHQKKHWKQHSKSCRPFKIAEDSNIGRHYVASRKIDVGEIVLKDEKPLVVGPMFSTPPVCLNCCAILTASTAVPCSKCGWPLCKDCKSHGPECDFTSRYRNEKVSITEFEHPHPTYKSICLIRALSLRESDPESYRKLLNLEDHYDLIMTQQLVGFFENPHNIARFVKRFFKINDVPEEEIARIVCIFQVNGHEVPNVDRWHMAVYDTASFFEHSCRANCSKTVTDNASLIIRAAVPIAEGDHMSICYTHPLWGLTRRKYYLEQTKFFKCTCERCKDPTEFGTMFNAMSCTNSQCTGYMLPKTYIVQDDDLPNYTCNKCGSTTTWDQVEQTLLNIGIQAANIEKNNAKECKNFLNRFKHILHKNHFHNIDVEIAYVQLIYQSSIGSTDTDDDLLAEKMLLCEKLNALLKILAPAANRVRGMILFETHEAMIGLAARQGSNKLEILMESRKILLESYQLLKYEPKWSVEGQMALRARNILQHANSVMKTLKNSVTPL